MMGNHIHSVMNPVPTLEEEKGDDGEPHTFSNESSSYTGRRRREMMGNHIHSVMNPVPTLEEEKGDDGEPHTFSNESSSYTGRRKGR